MCENCKDCKNCNGDEKGFNPARRKLMAWMVGIINVLVGIAIIGPVVGFIASPVARKRKGEWVPVFDVGDLDDGMTDEFSFTLRLQDGYHEADQTFSLFFQRKQDSYIAFDPSCTHLGCRISFQRDKDRYFCPCHGGVFDVDGKVVAGPPPKPLIQHETKVENGKVWVYKEV